MHTNNNDILPMTPRNQGPDTVFAEIGQAETKSVDAAITNIATWMRRTTDEIDTASILKLPIRTGSSERAINRLRNVEPLESR